MKEMKKRNKSRLNDKDSTIGFSGDDCGVDLWLNQHNGDCLISCGCCSVPTGLMYSTIL